MIENQNLLFQLEKLLSWKKSKAFYADKLGITEEEVAELLKELKEKESVPQVLTDANEKYEAFRKVNIEKGTAESTIVVDFEPKNDIELAKLHKINLDKYVITNYWSKRLPNGKFTSSVFSKIKAPKDYTPEDFAKFLNNYKPSYVPLDKSNHVHLFDIDVEISIADFHLAKQVIDGPNCLKERKNLFLRMVKNLIGKVRAVSTIDRIVLPIGNDFFHTDNYQNQTTNGTPQDVIADYASEYEAGFDVLVEAISFLNENAREVHVVLVQGNHDRTKDFYLAHALEVFFKKDSNIHFQRNHSTTKSIVLGNTFIGYHHGNCKIDDLPLLFATGKDAYSFGNAKYREVHTGDKHFYMAKEIKGVRIQQMPSLSGADRWHADNNYVNNIRSAIATMYDTETGRIGEFEERI
jgi:hypothetical protein